ncbi:MAG: UDP-3-O-(3-hydroxymyristoyl)glucosamine N-acyltransferase [Nitrospirae bacterium]|nr:UDP-3-O-(3-hydroxymyristoyl)glucosamine N-acyltransferase [Nitrospirota bacterium]
MKLREIAGIIGGRILGDPDIEITGVSGIHEAKPGDITFLSGKKKSFDLSVIKASAIIAKEEIKGLALASILLVDNPYLAFAKALELFHKKPYKPSGISNKAIIGNNVSFGNDVSIYPLAYVSDNAQIGSRVSIFPGVYIGEGVIIGDDSVIYPNVSIIEGTRIGSRVTVYSGTVIGSDGFGYVPVNGTYYKMPQVGGVIIEDEVEIGANVTIDRATTADTIIGFGTKIDNSVHIAHNVKIGKHCIIIAQVGISGSVEIGNGVIIGGQAGVIEHIKIGNDAVISAKTGVTEDVPNEQVTSGYPSMPHKTWLRAQSNLRKLPNYIKRIQELERRAGIDSDKK